MDGWVDGLVGGWISWKYSQISSAKTEAGSKPGNDTVEIIFLKASYSEFCLIYFFKTISQYAFSKAILSKVELIWQVGGLILI